METQLRSSGHPRLVVELLLLRWAMMDRTVEIGEVLEALGKGEEGRGKGRLPPPPPAQMRDSAPPSPSPFPLPPSPEKGPLTAERLGALWPSIVSRARGSSAMLATLLADAKVVAVSGDTVTLSAAGHDEGLQHKKEAIGKLIGEWVSGTVKVAVERGPGSGPRDPGTASPRPERLTEQTANLERLKVLRAKDPTLGAAVDALDLELLE
jgi:DNA polymerase-3 subunit gamma/tau